ncbi:MAG: hypothetical protein ACRDRJ_49520, partial [Streptosporangiaceae bacterium]
PLEPAAATAAVRDGLRSGAGSEGAGSEGAGSEGAVPGPGPDRYLAPEIGDAVEYVRSGRAIAAAERVTGPLR